MPAAGATQAHVRIALSLGTIKVDTREINYQPKIF